MEGRDSVYNLKAEQREFVDELEVEKVAKEGIKCNVQVSGWSGCVVGSAISRDREDRKRVGVSLGIKNLFMDVLRLRCAIVTDSTK